MSSVAQAPSQLFQPGDAARFIQQTGHKRYVMICSIFPLTQVFRHNNIGLFDPETGSNYDNKGNLLGNSIELVMPPAAYGKYNLMRIWDTYTMTMSIGESLGPETNTPRRADISCIQLARDVQRSFASTSYGADDERQPGVAIISGDTPTKEELARLKQIQTLYFQLLIDDASKKFADPKTRGEVHSLHRAAAEWLKVTDSERYPWIRPQTGGDVKNCIGCGKEINMNALSCQHCNQNLVEFAKTLPMNLVKQRDPMVADILVMIAQENAAKN